jgi:hypothetical protein
VKYAAAALVLALLLTGCAGTGKNESEEMLDIRARYLAEGEMTLSAELTADYGERVYVYSLRYTGGAEAGTMDVYEPRCISGVRAAYEDGRVTLICQDAVIDTGELIFGMCPLEAFPFMISAWRNGSITDCRRERLDGTDCIAADIDMDKWQSGAKCRVWFARETQQPLLSEIYDCGRCVMRCRFAPDAPAEN